MFFLIKNVFPHGLEMRSTYTEQPVAILPVKVCNAQRLYEFGRIFLENLNDLSRWEFFRKIAEDVHVIRHASNGDCITFQVLENA